MELKILVNFYTIKQLFAMQKFQTLWNKVFKLSG